MDSIGKMGQPLSSPHSGGHPTRIKCTHDETCPRDAKKMPGHRHRNKDGRLQLKRGDTYLSTLERELGEFSCRPDNTRLSELRQIAGEKGMRKVAKKIKQLETVSIPEKNKKNEPPPKFMTEI